MYFCRGLTNFCQTANETDVSTLCDRPLAVLSAPWPDSRHERLHLHTPPSVPLCSGKTAGLQSGSPDIQQSCRKYRDCIFVAYLLLDILLMNLLSCHGTWHVTTGKTETGAINNCVPLRCVTLIFCMFDIWNTATLHNSINKVQADTSRNNKWFEAAVYRTMFSAP